MHKYLFIIIFLLSSSCNPLMKNCIRFGTKDNKKELFFYTTDLFEVDGNKFYDVSLIITNYENGSMKPYDFVTLAKSYLDTSNIKDLPIGVITFLGQKKGDCLPDFEFIEDNQDVINRHSIINVYYDVYNKDSIKRNPKEISSLQFWYKGEMGKLIKLNSVERVDSIMHSKEFVDNGY